MKGLVSNIQRFSIYDGPGIRTTVFLKGCNLRCFWCHNPENLISKPEIQFFEEKCIGCGKCFELCPQVAHRLEDGKRSFMRENCQGCGRCAESCYAEALELVGQEMTADEVIDTVLRDMPFYVKSGGGVTFSGGEALIQREFINTLLIKSKKRGLHCTIDTAGHVPWKTFEDILDYVDLFLYDIKIMNSDKHREATGVSNEMILENLKRLVAEGASVWVRIPIIPGFNDSLEEMEDIALFVKETGGVDLVELLPYHNIGQSKYESLGMIYGARDIKEPPTKEHMAKLGKIFDYKNIKLVLRN